MQGQIVPGATQGLRCRGGRGAAFDKSHRLSPLGLMPRCRREQGTIAAKLKFALLEGYTSSCGQFRRRRALGLVWLAGVLYVLPSCTSLHTLQSRRKGWRRGCRAISALIARNQPCSLFSRRGHPPLVRRRMVPQPLHSDHLHTYATLDGM